VRNRNHYSLVTSCCDANLTACSMSAIKSTATHTSYVYIDRNFEYEISETQCK